MKKILFMLMLVGLCGCKSGHKQVEGVETRVKIETSMGDVVVKLYNETPKHRDNFIKLAKKGVYKGTLFHRVIKDFMVQAGDPTSKGAEKGQMLGMGDVGYTIPAEIIYPKLYHKRGVLSAARQPDQVNPDRASSGCQFYIVTGKVYNDSTLALIEDRIEQGKIVKFLPELMTKHRAEVDSIRATQNQDALRALQNRLMLEAADMRMASGEQFHFTPEQRDAYTTVGGTPFLDGEYTVFGEVVEGMDVVDKIQQVKTDERDRPLDDVVIKRVKVLAD